MPFTTDVQEHIPFAQFDRRERYHRLSAVREHLREIGEEIFEISCRLQKQYDRNDVREALLLVAELKMLRACEERLSEKTNF